MNKTELVNAVAAKAGIKKEEAKKTVDATVEANVEAVKKDDKVALVGFGTFAKTKRAARQGVNPATGAKIKIAAKEVFKFKASSSIL